jgi:hypothetical protein
MFKVVQGGEESDGGTAGFRSLIDEIVRDGARKMLAAALQAEVAAYVEQFAEQVDEDGRRLVVRNGYHQLDPSAHDEPHRIYFRDSAFEEQGHQGAGLAAGRARDGVQADRGR